MAKTHKKFYPEELKAMIFAWRMAGVEYSEIQRRVQGDPEFKKFAHRLTLKVCSNMVANMKHGKVAKAVKGGMRTSAVKKKFKTKASASELRQQHGKNSGNGNSAKSGDDMYSVELVLPKKTSIFEVADALAGIKGAHIRV